MLASIINASSGRSWSSDTYNPCPGVMEGVPAARGYAGGFACDLMIKDLSLAASAAASSAPPPVLTGHVSSLPRTNRVCLQQVAKLCNNLLLGITMAGVSEAFNLGQ